MSAIAAVGPARWRESEFRVLFDAKPTADVSFEGYNARIESVRPAAGGAYSVKATVSDAPSDSNDAAIVTVRCAERSFSFLVNELEGNDEIYVKPFGVRVLRPGAKPAAPNGETITARVLRMPEQTYGRAMSAIPPKRRNKWLSLSPPLNPRKFAVLPDGNLFSRRESKLVYEFATGDAPDFALEEPQHVEEDYLPVLYGSWREGSLRWEQAYVVTATGDFDDPKSPTAMVTKVTAANEGDSPAPARLRFRLRRENDKPLEPRLDGEVLMDGDLPRALLAAGLWDVRQEQNGEFVCAAELAPGESRSLELKVPSSRDRAEFEQAREGAERATFDGARDQTTGYWRAKVARAAGFDVPDGRVNRIWKSLLIHQYCWGNYDEENGTYQPNVAAFAYGPVGNESTGMCKALDYFGHHEMARNYYEPMWKDQGTDELQARVTNGDGCLVGWRTNYVFNTGFQLWNLGNHYRLTGDRKWLDQVVPSLIKACDWLVQQRKTTLENDPDGRPLVHSGFFPPCGLEDEWRWHYWAMTNGYFHLGMSSTAELLAEIGHPDARRIADDASAFLADLRRGIQESIVRCAVVRLRDGTYVPYVPKHLYRRGRSEGHYEAELGALHLLTTNVYAPDSDEMDWTLSFHEDAVYMTEAPDHKPIISFENIERDWFCLGGFGKTQPYLVHTQMAYLRRDQPKLFLRSFWNQLVAQNSSDINAFPEHICWNGAADCKTYEEAMWLQQFRSMLILDEDGKLRLGAAAPREWLEDGKTISVTNAPSFYGPVSFVIRSEARRGTINAKVSLDARRKPKEFFIRLRHPQEARMKGVTVNGKPSNEFDPRRETIALPPGGGEFEIVAKY